MLPFDHIALTLLCGLCLGCSAFGPDEPCKQLFRTTKVQYVGHAFGEGTITLKNEGQRVVGAVVLNGERSEDPSFELPATGTCRNGIARLRLGARHSPLSDTRILGGRLVLVYDAELLRSRFGMWHAEIQASGQDEVRKLHGYVREQEVRQTPPPQE